MDQKPEVGKVVPDSETYRSKGQNFFTNKVETPLSLSSDETSLLSAAWRGDWKKIRELVEKSINCNIQSPEGYTPLYIAAKNGNTSVVRELLKFPGIKVNQTHKDGITPAWIAASLGHAHVLTLLAKRGADLTKTTKTCNHNLTILEFAIQKGHINVIHVLSHYVDINQQLEDTGLWTIHAATHFDSARGFLICNETPEASPPKAFLHDHFILTATSLFYCSVKKGELKFITRVKSKLIELRQIFTKEIDYLSRAQLQSIALITGESTTQSNKRVHALLQCQADPNLQSSQGFTPIYMAIKMDNLELVKTFADYNASLNSIYNGNTSAIHLAAELGKADILSVLLDYGANPFLEVAYRVTPLFMAAQENQKDIVRIYKKKYSIESLQTQAQFTIDHLRNFSKKRGDAIVQRMEKLIREKVSTGNDLIPVTAAEIAEVMGNEEIVEILREPEKANNFCVNFS